MQLHELKRNTPNKRTKRVGRGGKRGKTSGRGHKGQNARAGTGGRPEIRDMIKKLPKLRGHGVNRARTVNSGRIKPTVVNFDVLEANFNKGDHVTPETLKEKKLITTRSGKLPAVKVLARGTLTKALTISGCALSETAKAALEKAGGKVS